MRFKLLVGLDVVGMCVSIFDWCDHRVQLIDTEVNERCQVKLVIDAK
jgi:hypothetical protein